MLYFFRSVGKKVDIFCPRVPVAIHDLFKNSLWYLPYLYWIPKLHKTPYKERYIAGSSNCSTKELSIHLTKIMSAVKEGQ